MIRVVAIAVFSIALWLPLFQRQSSFFAENKLSGIEENTLKPDFSLQSFWDGEFQKKYQSWFNENVGFRGALIRSENQLNLSFFKDISSRSPSRINLGQAGYLFERSYLQSYQQPDSTRNEKLLTIVERTKKLQELLSQRGIAFLLLISPSKAELYPEKLPRYIAEAVRNPQSDYTVFTEALQAVGVHTLDGYALLKSIKDSTGYPVFPKSGTHWSYYATCLVTNRMVELLEQQLKEKLIKVDCSNLVWSDQPRLHDKDLAELINVWDPSSTFERLPYPRSKSIRSGGEFRPKIIIVGSSFIWPILHYLDRHKIFVRRDFYYYFRTNHSSPPPKQTPIDPASLDWEQKVFSRKAIIIEINQAALSQTGFGFIEHALAALEGQALRPDTATAGTVKN